MTVEFHPRETRYIEVGTGISTHLRVMSQATPLLEVPLSILSPSNRSGGLMHPLPRMRWIHALESFPLTPFVKTPLACGAEDGAASRESFLPCLESVRR